MKKKFVLVLLSFILLFPIAFSEVYSNEEFEYTVNENGTVDIHYYIGSSESISIPDTLENLPVTNIDDCAFFAISSLKTVVIPEGVTSIKWMAFAGCENLQNVVIPDSVTDIDSSAFSGSDKLTLIVNPGSYAESYCIQSSLPYAYEITAASVGTPDEPMIETSSEEEKSKETSHLQEETLYAIPTPKEDGITYQAQSDHHFTYVINTDGTVTVTEYIGDKCDELGCECSGIIIPNTLDGRKVTAIGPKVGVEYAQVALLEIGENVIYIDPGLFGDLAYNAISEFRVSPYNPVYTSHNGILYNRVTSELVSVGRNRLEDDSIFFIPDGTVSVGDFALAWNKVSEVFIPNSVTEIGRAAFWNNLNLRSIYIPASVTSIEDQALSTLTSTEIFVSPDNPVYTTIQGVVFDKVNKKLLRYPGQNNTINWETEEELSAYDLKTYTVPYGILEIGHSSFCSSKDLTSVYLPETVERIGSLAFAGCRNLTHINIPKSVRYIGEINCFVNCSKLTIEVIKGSYAEQYCIDNQLNYIAVDDLSWLDS